MSDQSIVVPDIDTIRLDWITRDSELQPREGLNDDPIGQYAEQMMAGVVFPPVVVYWDQQEQRYWLSQGFHRCAAAEAAELTTILAEFRQGSRDDALWDALGSNREFDAVGQRRSNRDKQRAVQKALKARPHLSDRQIAEHVGVTHPYVMKLRRVVTVTTSGDRRVGRDGKSYPAHPTQPPQAMPVSPQASPDGGERPDLDNNVIEIAVDRPGELPDSPPLVTPAPVSLASRPKPVSLTPGSAPTPTPTRLPVLQQTNEVITPRPRRFLIDLDFADVTARAIRAEAPPEFVRELVEKLADDNDLIEIVQRHIIMRVAAATFGDADEADCPTCVIPLEPERAVRALQVGFHPNNLRYMADLILKVTEVAEGAPDEASASLDGKVSREITPGAGDEE